VQVLLDQDGVIARRQALASGMSVSDIARQLRRRAWASVHPGVYIDHTGPLTWLQRSWAAVLFSWPAALSHESAIRAGDGPGRRGRDDSVIHVAVDWSRNLVEPPGVVIHRTRDLDRRVRWNMSPPRVRYEEAVLDLAADATSDLDAIAVLADACGARRTTALRLVGTLNRRTRIARRAWLDAVLRDVAEGTCSVLEHGYLDRVERPHGLPRGRRQVSRRHPDQSEYSDVDYDEFGVIVELDGRVFHESARARDRDMDRDLDAAVDDKETLRVSYGQVFDRGCRTATKIATVLGRRGWRGEPHPCRECG